MPEDAKEGGNDSEALAKSLEDTQLFHGDGLAMMASPERNPPARKWVKQWYFFSSSQEFNVVMATALSLHVTETFSFGNVMKSQFTGFWGTAIQSSVLCSCRADETERR